MSYFEPFADVYFIFCEPLWWRLRVIKNSGNIEINMYNQNQESRKLAYLLRHSYLPNHDGWVSINVLVQEYCFTSQELEHIVFEDDKGRFELSEDVSYVRALYGHSIDVDLGLIPSSPPAILYHGTADKYIERIMKEGLKPCKRNYVQHYPLM